MDGHGKPEAFRNESGRAAALAQIKLARLQLQPTKDALECSICFMLDDPNQISLFPTEQTPAEQNSTEQNLSEQQRPDQTRQVTDPVEELLDPESEESQFLCQLASMIQQMAPWNFMEETDVFGFVDPETSELGFVSVMGKLGEHRAIAVYRGVEGLYGWRHFEEALQLDPKSVDAHDLFFEIPQIQLSFESSTLLEKRDRAIIKASGFKFPRNQQPRFRSYRPGYLPWFITAEEASHLIYALAQTLNVASRIFTEADLLPLNEAPEDCNYLIRVPRMKESQPQWEDSFVSINPPPTHLVPFSLEESMMKQLKALGASGVIEIDLFNLPARVGRSYERPRLIYALLTVEPDSGFVLGMELLEAIDGMDLMYASLVEKLASQFVEHQIVPEEIKACSNKLLNVLQPLEDELDIALTFAKTLPALNRARRSLMEHFG